jgi:hypothetical protein
MLASVSKPAGGWQVRPVDEARGRRTCIPSEVALVDMNITQKSAQASSLTVLGSALRFRPSSMSSMSFPPFYDPSFAGAFSTLTSTIDTYTGLMSALYVGDSRQITPLPLAVPPVQTLLFDLDPRWLESCKLGWLVDERFSTRVYQKKRLLQQLQSKFEGRCNLPERECREPSSRGTEVNSRVGGSTSRIR